MVLMELVVQAVLVALLLMVAQEARVALRVVVEGTVLAGQVTVVVVPMELVTFSSTTRQLGSVIVCVEMVTMPHGFLLLIARKGAMWSSWCVVVNCVSGVGCLSHVRTGRKRYIVELSYVFLNI